ncbi:Acyl-CoA dehydrogenase, short-chain specific [Paraburkholderia aspalathi]|uniref:Acyl-CoA dehydrogenase, short-chain specific n=1 Tax=Paraburkholderia aspalathi TaxID=1324617 RepID=A0ABN7N2L0_9BURK|nr:3-sulfinopropanoyl-CoA desulfinase [Paraburkholderia aspalathi]MBK3823240.1 acyl-CoA dehydrogenase [Paraburkholderia aspalathi]MBK3835082.1 acyl-CoA dehydrogenase [Paraburkholderia aspalathi]MBK3864826.1 acyl-CoA dehydrogenase [Paraburkholderia aspalathi]CAE6844910.1 Acyl-CoA dehydrogenase, short-chain specific [Paraburkholderia aspalathi]
MDLYLSSEQQKLRESARELATCEIAPRAAEIDRTEIYNWDNIQALKDAGFMGYTVPVAYGGKGGSFLDATLIIEEMAKVCGATGRVAVESNMGAISAVMEYGSEAQKRLAAELVLSGDKPAICITEPEAGSAATEMTTNAVKHGDVYVINGRKHWITGGGVSKLHLIFARVFDECGEEQGIGGFLALKGAPGLIIGKREPAMGVRGIPETEVIFEDLEVAGDMVLVPPSGVRRGFADLINAYNSQRVGAATVALGIAQGAFDQAARFVKERHQFGRPIAEFQGLQWMLADMAVQLNAARLGIHQAAKSAAPFPDPLLAAQAKIFAAEMAITVTNQALQLHGSAGYSRNNPLERMVRDARMFSIAGGTAQVLRTLVAGRLLGMKLPQTRDGYVRA